MSLDVFRLKQLEQHPLEIMELLKNMGREDIDNFNVSEDEDKKREEFTLRAIEKGYLRVVSPDHVMMMEVRRERLIRYVSSMLDTLTLESQPKIPDNLYKDKVELASHKTTHLPEYLEVIWKYAKKLEEQVTIEVSTNIPTTFYIGDDVKFYLAPVYVEE